MKRLSVVVVASILALAGAELFLRLFAPVEFQRPHSRDDPTVWTSLIHQPSPVPGLDYEIAPDRWGSGAHRREGINSHGFRGRAPSDPKTGTRIVVLGDSFTYGLGVGVEQTYPAALERLLDETPGVGPVEVLNLGVTAYSLHDLAAVLEHRALALEPDLVIVGYVLNDPQIGTGGQPIRVFYHATRWWQHSHLLRLGAKAKRDWDVRRRGGGDYIRALYADDATWRAALESLGTMRTASRVHPVEVLFVVFPMIPEESWDEYAYGDIHDRVGAALREAGFPVLDLRAAMALHPPPALRLPGEDWHPSAYGYEVAAWAIRDFLVAEGFLPDRAAHGPERGAPGP